MSIPLTGGIDRKTDKHQLSSGQMYTADNVQYISQKQLSKRYGCQGIYPPGGLQGAPFTAIGIRDNVEPVIQGGNVLNRYNPATGLSTSVSAPTQGRSDSVAVASSTGNTATAVVPSYASCATDKQKYVCVAWEETQSPQNTKFYWGIQDLATGNWIISPRTQASTAFSGGMVNAPKVAYMAQSNTFAIFWIETSGTSQDICNGDVYLTNLAAGLQVSNPPLVIQSTTGATNNYSTWGYDVLTNFNNAYFTNGTIVGWMKPSSAAGTTGTANVAIYPNDQRYAQPTITSTSSLSATSGAQKIALGSISGTLAAATNQQITTFGGAALTPQTVRSLSGSFTNASGSFGITNFIGTAPALLSLNGNLLWFSTVYTVDSNTSTYSSVHNVMAIVPVSGGVPGTVSSVISVDPPNNTLTTSYLSKPFFNNLTQNVYAYIGAGGYSDANTYANTFLMEIPTPGLGTVAKPIARLLYGVTGNIGRTTAQNSLTEVLPTLSPSRFITFLSTQTFDASFSSSSVPLTYYGNLNLTGFDFNPPRGNQLLPIPQGGVFATSAFPWEYDGQQVVESGFSTAPAVVSPQSTTTSGGALLAATYWYRLCFVKRDAYGNVTRSSPSNPFSVTTSANGTVKFPPLSYSGGNVYVEFYRSVSTTSTSAAAPGVYYLIGSVPQNTVFTDTGAYTDATLQAQMTIYTASGEIENDPPPPVHHMAFGETRAFIIPSDARNQIWYSKPYVPGKQLEFSANFTVNEGANAGLFTAIAVLDTNVICFKADSIAYFSGTGPDATGTNGSFSQFARLSSDVGCVDPGSLAIIPGGLLFRSRRGIELLTRGLQVQYVGFAVEPLAQAITTIGSAVVLPKYTQVRFVPSVPGQPVLVYDYQFSRWSTYSSMASVQANTLSGQYWWISADGSTVLQETPGQFLDNGANIMMTVETPELPLAGIQGWGRAYRMAVLGDFKSSHQMNVSFAYDHSPNYQDQIGYSIATQADIDNVVSGLTSFSIDSVGWDLENPGALNPYLPAVPGASLGRAPTVVSPPCAEQFRLSRMPRQRMQVCRIMLQDTPVLASFRNDGSYQTTPLAFGESCAISDITLEFGQKAGVAKLGPQGTV